MSDKEIYRSVKQFLLKDGNWFFAGCFVLLIAFSITAAVTMNNAKNTKNETMAAESKHQATIPNTNIETPLRLRDMRIGDQGWIQSSTVCVDSDHHAWLYLVSEVKPEKSLASTCLVKKEVDGWHVIVTAKDVKWRVEKSSFDDKKRYAPVVELKLP